ncbi:MAG TPA: tetratricopeptide repeat protein [Thermoanaerobaculia bacterium]|nr:tetratricopeptide repeat protein [Thermoanaerobaculia bacterium]
MSHVRRAAWAALALAALLPPALHAAGEGRVLGTVEDDAGQPLADVRITVTSPEFKYLQEKKSDAKGKFSLLVLDATRPYAIKLEKEGHQPFEAPLQVQLGETVRVGYTLARSVPQAAAEEGAPAAEEGAGEAIKIYNEGVLAFNAGDQAAAVAKFEQAATLDPKLVAAPLTLSGLYLDQKKHAEAAAAAEKVLALEPANAMALRNRYDAYNEGGDKAKADAALQALVAGVKDRETAVRVFNLGATAARNDDMDTAVARIRQALEIDPTLEQGYSSLAGIYLSKKQYKEAAELAEKHLAVNANSLEAMTVRAEAYRQLGDKAKAAEAAQQMEAAQATMSADDFYRQGVALYNANNVAAAKEAFGRALAKDASHARSHYMLGLCHASTGENPKAREHLTKFLELAPTDNDAATAKEMLETLK